MATVITELVLSVKYMPLHRSHCKTSIKVCRPCMLFYPGNEKQFRTQTKTALLGMSMAENI